MPKQKGKPQKKFRADKEIQDLIRDKTKQLGLPNESAAIRVLLKQGSKVIDDFFNHAWNVTHPLKYSEIDYLTTALNISLKARKKEQDKAK